MTAAETSYGAEKQTDLARRAAREFDSIPLRKQVRDDIQDDCQLGHLLDAVAHLRCAVHEREQETGTESMLYRELETAQNGVAGYAEDSRVGEIVARACATVVEDGAEWAGSIRSIRSISTRPSPRPASGSASTPTSPDGWTCSIWFQIRQSVTGPAGYA